MIVHSVLTHHPAPVVDAMMSFLSRLGKSVTFVVAYGGPESEFGNITFPHKVFLDDPCLRGPTDAQNFSCWLLAVTAWIRQSGMAPKAVYFSENDHLIFRRDYWTELERALDASGLDFLGKWCGNRSNTNDFFYLRYRDHAPLLAHLAAVSVRDNPTMIWGALANGMLFRWAALERLCAVDLSLPCFTEILVPSMLYHIGLRLGDFDAFTDLYRHVRYRPSYLLKEIPELLEKGAWCCHPFKDRDSLDALYALCEQRSLAPRS